MKHLLLLILILFLSTSFVFAETKIHMVDLDNDGEGESVTYEQKFEVTEDMIPLPVEAEVAIFETNGIKAAKFFMPDHVGKLEFTDLNGDGFKQIVAWSYGGAHYTNLAICGYKDGEVYKIFANGSACAVETDFDADKLIIRVGRANWDKEGWCYADDPLWQVYAWNGKEFIYEPELSTISELNPETEVNRYVNKLKSILEE